MPTGAREISTRQVSGQPAQREASGNVRKACGVGRVPELPPPQFLLSVTWHLGDSSPLITEGGTTRGIIKNLSNSNLLVRGNEPVWATQLSFLRLWTKFTPILTILCYCLDTPEPMVNVKCLQGSEKESRNWFIGKCDFTAQYKQKFPETRMGSKVGLWLLQHEGWWCWLLSHADSLQFPTPPHPSLRLCAYSTS